MLDNKIIQHDDKLLSIGIIHSFPDCDDQAFHYDYMNNTFTIFLPLVDIDEDNGTEYIEMLNHNYESVVEQLITRNYKTHLYEELKELIDNEAHALRRVVSQKYNLIKLNKNVFHRGVKNRKTYSKKMFQFVFTDVPEYKFNYIEPYYSNAENDEFL
jgi:hypothetical protein